MSAPASHDLVHASHVRLAYRAMLGREASPDEVRMQLSGLRTTSELLAIIAGSPEFTGTAQVLLGPKPSPAIANVWHPDLAEWTHAPGTRSLAEDTVVGEEGLLFSRRGFNGDTREHTGETAMPEGWAQAWSDLVTFRREESTRLGIKSISVVVPDRLSVCADLFPEPLDIIGRRPILRLMQELDLPLVYPLDELVAARADGEVFMRTAPHCTLHGNDAVHRAVAAALGVTPLTPAALADPKAWMLSGDLGLRFDPAIVERVQATMSLGSATLIEGNGDEIRRSGGHIGSHNVFRNEDAPNEQCVVIFGDGDSAAWDGFQGLTWFIAQLFREVHFAWVPFGWDSRYAERVGAGIVISQTAERFLSRVPAQSTDVDALVERAQSEGAPLSPDLVFETLS